MEMEDKLRLLLVAHPTRSTAAIVVIRIFICLTCIKL